MTNIEKLRTLAMALHGPRWQNAVARDLGIDRRRVHRWTRGDLEPHAGHVADLVAIAEDRLHAIQGALESASAL